MDKPNTLEEDIPIVIRQNSNTEENNIIYGKPNEYEVPEEHLTQEVLDDLIIRAEFIDGKRPPILTNDEDEERSSNNITSHLLSHVPNSTISLTSPITLSPSASGSSNNSNSSSATSRLALLQILKNKPMEDMVNYDLRKYSLSRSHEIDVYLKGTRQLIYKKIQPHSYSWGFQNILYKYPELNSDKIKVAEARRRAFRKEITIEWGNFTSNNDAFSIDEEEEEVEVKEERLYTKSNQLHNKTGSHLLFTYETEFEGYKIRWKRANLLSHDLVCELKYNVPAEHSKSQWHVIAEFDSYRMGYFIHLGELIIDKNALLLVEKHDQFEAHIVITLTTLIDLMRELVEKAIGLSKGGVIGSD